MDYYKKGEEKFGCISSRIYAFGSKHSMKDIYLFAAKDIKKFKPKNIIDIGAGPGDLAILLSKTFKNTNICCVDPSASMKSIAEKRFRKLGIQGIKYGLGSSRHIPFKGKFDVIVTTISFHHWKEKKDSIKYLLKKLAIGGRLIICEFYYDKLSIMQKTIIGKHALSLKEANKYSFKGYRKDIEIHNKIIVMSFVKSLKRINNKH